MNDSTPVQRENAELLDRALNDVLKNGQVVIDDDGNPVRITPTAAMFNVIRSRCRDIGINALPVHGSPAGDLIEAAARAGLKYNGKDVALPPIDDESDDAAAV